MCVCGSGQLAQFAKMVPTVLLILEILRKLANDAKHFLLETTLSGADKLLNSSGIRSNRWLFREASGNLFTNIQTSTSDTRLDRASFLQLKHEAGGGKRTSKSSSLEMSCIV